MCEQFETKLRVYLKSERAMLDVLVQNKLRQCFLIGIGLITLLTALVMLDIALFFKLAAYLSISNTALVLAGANALLFLVFLLCAKIRKHRKEVEALREIRDFAKEEVAKDLKEVGQSAHQAVHSVSSIFTGEAFSLASVLAAVHHLLQDKK